MLLINARSIAISGFRLLSLCVVMQQHFEIREYGMFLCHVRKAHLNMDDYVDRRKK